jgi:hypothetical protein
VISLLGLAARLLAGGSAAADAETLSDEEPRISMWNYSGALRGSLGYKDNVLLSHTNAESSALWMSSAEFMVFRLPTHGWQFSFFAEATDIRFFDAPSVDNEQLALAAAQLSKDFGGGWKSTWMLNYLFQNQVYDNSANYYTNQTAVGVIRGNLVSPRWAVRKTFASFWVEGEMDGLRQWLDAPLDSYWQCGPRTATGFDWGNGSEISLAYQYERLNYDHRPQVSTTETVLTNTLLALNTHRIELAFTQVWDRKQRWRTVTVAGCDFTFDNGPGFYDYNCYRISQQVRYRDEKWEIVGQARAGYYHYSEQTVSVTDTSRRSKTMITLAVRAERKLARNLVAQAAYTWDRSLSNLDFDDYQSGMLSGGLAFTF